MTIHLLTWAAALIGGMVMTLSVSAYTDAGGVPPFRGLTTSGASTRPGVAACGPWLFELRATLSVPGSPELFYTCLDRGAAITDGHMALWVATDAEALEWGRREKVVIVLPLPPPQVMMVHPCVGWECKR